MIHKMNILRLIKDLTIMKEKTENIVEDNIKTISFHESCIQPFRN